MARFVVLDAGPSSDASKAPGNPSGDRCRAWIASVVAVVNEVILPAISDYEVRRELIRAGMSGGVRRLDDLRVSLNFLRLTDEALLRAAEFWAIVRNLGRPTAHHQALDGDAILAAEASLRGMPGGEVVIATTNVGHLARFPGVDARNREKVAP